MLSPIMSKANLIKELIIADIKKGKYKEGDRLPSDNDLMGDLKVSRNTVREALSFLTSEGYVIRIQGKGSFVASANPSEKVKTSKLIYIIAADLHGSKEDNPFIGRVLRGVLGALEGETYGIRLATFNPKNDWFISPETIDEICSQQPAGIIFSGFTPTKNIVKQFHQKQIKCCSIGEPEDGVDIPFVAGENFNAVRDATNHLLEIGHKKIAFLNFHDGDPSSNARKEGYIAAFKEAGLVHDSQLLVFSDAMTIKSGKQKVKELLESCSDLSAIVICGDYLTLGVIQELQASGKKIPKEMSLIMYAGYNWVCNVADLDVSRFEQDDCELARKAVKLLLDDSGKGDHKVTLDAIFVKGKTCRKKRAR